MEVLNPQEPYFTITKDQINSFRSLKSLEEGIEREQDVPTLLARIAQFIEFFKVVIIFLFAWINAQFTGEDVVLTVLSGKESSLKDDPNYEFLQPQGAKRFVLRPVRFPILLDYAEKLRDMPWTPKSADVDLGSDKKDFLEICAKEPGVKPLIENVLGYFAPSDGIILENVQSNFGEEVAIPEVRAWFAVQGQNEYVHEDMYSLLIECYVESPSDRERLFNSIENMPAVKAKATWAQFWLNRRHSFAERLVAYSAVEGIHFASSFSIIWWIKSRFPGKMPGLTKSNEWISRDENMHVEFAIALYFHLARLLPLERIRQIYESALKVELTFVRTIMSQQRISGLTLESLEEHVRYMANFWFALYQDPKKPIELLVTNPDGSEPQPRPEFRAISKFSKVNFFEVKNANYVQPEVQNQHVQLAVKF
jgi:ribonucleoside-diphosphate reductase beta chain